MGRIVNGTGKKFQADIELEVRVTLPDGVELKIPYRNIGLTSNPLYWPETVYQLGKQANEYIRNVLVNMYGDVPQQYKEPGHGE